MVLSLWDHLTLKIWHNLKPSRARIIKSVAQDDIFLIHLKRNWKMLVALTLLENMILEKYIFTLSSAMIVLIQLTSSSYIPIMLLPCNHVHSKNTIFIFERLLTDLNGRNRVEDYLNKTWCHQTWTRRAEGTDYNKDMTSLLWNHVTCDPFLSRRCLEFDCKIKLHDLVLYGPE